MERRSRWGCTQLAKVCVRSEKMQTGASCSPLPAVELTNNNNNNNTNNNTNNNNSSTTTTNNNNNNDDSNHHLGIQTGWENNQAASHLWNYPLLSFSGEKNLTGGFNGIW